jgi:glycosyltransferase involved in cell wall biosynthesis
MKMGMCLSFFGDLEGMRIKMGGNLERATIGLLLKKYSESFDEVFIFSHDRKDFSSCSWFPKNARQVRMYNKYLFVLFGWIVVSHYVKRHDIRFLTVQGASGLHNVFMVNRLTKARVMLQYDNTMYLTARNFLKRFVYKVAEKALLNFVDYFMISSREIRKFAGKRKGILPVVKGIMLDELQVGKVKESPLMRNIPGKKIVYIGRLSEEKDPITAIKAYRIAKKKMPDLHLIFCGGGRLLDECKRIADEDVHFLGFVKDVPGILKGADIFLISSVYDASPKALMEAMVMEKPCIATRVGGIPDFIDGSCGVLVDAKDAESMAESIVELLSDKKRARELAANARKRVLERHDLSKNIDSLIEIVKSDLERGTPGPGGGGK